MATEFTRRGFLRGSQQATGGARMRPPGAHRSLFLERCKDCEICISACPEDVTSSDDAGRPVLDFAKGSCTFCGACAEVCPTGALLPHLIEQWPWRAAIDAQCFSLNGIACRSCQDACESRAIRFKLKTGGRAEPSIDLDACTGCGACATVCPARSIHFDEVNAQHAGAAT